MKPSKIQDAAARKLSQALQQTTNRIIGVTNLLTRISLVTANAVASINVLVLRRVILSFAIGNNAMRAMGMPPANGLLQSGVSRSDASPWCSRGVCLVLFSRPRYRPSTHRLPLRFQNLGKSDSERFESQPEETSPIMSRDNRTDLGTTTDLLVKSCRSYVGKDFCSNFSSHRAEFQPKA
jgi:hypothetical protein